MDFDKMREKLKERFKRENLIRFLDKQGFYIVLFICICAIGATALWTSGGGIGVDKVPDDGSMGMEQDGEEFPLEPEDSEDIDIEIQDVITLPEEPEDEEEEPASVDTAGSMVDNESVDEEADPQLEVEPAAEQPEASKEWMVQPVIGEISMDYAMDELIYSRTLREYSTHPGVDIESPIGSEVKAAMAGTIDSIEEDPLMGIIITIDHGDGLMTRYANLSTSDMVVPGQEVEKGQTISGVGRNAISEIAEPSHLHFEVLMNGENVNPKEYLKP